jgi:hypothetical protein
MCDPGVMPVEAADEDDPVVAMSAPPFRKGSVVDGRHLRPAARVSVSALLADRVRISGVSRLLAKIRPTDVIWNPLPRMRTPARACPVTDEPFRLAPQPEPCRLSPRRAMTRTPRSEPSVDQESRRTPQDLVADTFPHRSPVVMVLRHVNPAARSSSFQSANPQSYVARATDAPTSSRAVSFAAAAAAGSAASAPSARPPSSSKASDLAREVRVVGARPCGQVPQPGEHRLSCARWPVRAPGWRARMPSAQVERVRRGPVRPGRGTEPGHRGQGDLPAPRCTGEQRRRLLGTPARHHRGPRAPSRSTTSPPVPPHPPDPRPAGRQRAVAETGPNVPVAYLRADAVRPPLPASCLDSMWGLSWERCKSRCPDGHR